MAGPASISTFIEIVERSGLVDAEQLEKLAADFATESPHELADLLIQRDLLTHWQAGLLLQGKYRGFRLGAYRLLELIGKGGMGSVYLAEHTTMRRRCAIKVLSSTNEEASSSLARFHREAQAVAALDHPNFVRAYEVNSEQQGERKVHYLVMEYIEGRTLQRIVEENGPLPGSQAAEYLRQTARGLAHAHQRGIIHRDIKPSNLILAHDGNVKILDLGLVSACGNDNAASLSNANKETLLGTADYVSPEQALGSSHLDERTDLYSLGCVAYFLLAGRPPFPDGTVAERLLAHQLREPLDIAELRKDIPRSFAVIVKAMLAKDPHERYQTASTIEAEITAWLDSAHEVLSGDRLCGNGSTIGMRSHAGDTRDLSKPNERGDTKRVDTLISGDSNQSVTVVQPAEPVSKPAAARSYQLALIVGAASALMIAAVIVLNSMRPPANTNTTAVDDGGNGTQTVPVVKQRGSATSNPAEQLQFERWSQLREQIRNDADTVLYLSFSDANRQTMTLANEASNTEFTQIGTEIHGQPQWVEGRLPQTRALRLGGPTTDQWLQISPEESTAFDFAGSFTLAMWVRLEPFTVEYQCLIAKGDNGWRISRNKRYASLHFAINEPDRKKDDPDIPPWAHTDGKSPVDDGNWHFVTAVFDAEGGEMTLSLFVDGELDGEPVTSAHRSAPNEDIVTIGANARNLLSFQEQEGRTFILPPRHLEGDIGELMIIRRPLTPERIKRIYEEGRPLPVEASGRK